jgi:2C-methyl-D-erythritol 2,4-cyclodiphosphate synthase
VLHAICDGFGQLHDIGRHFPDTFGKEAQRASVACRSSSADQGRGFTVNNIDATIVAERLKMAPHIPFMVATSIRFRGRQTRVNVKA